MRKIVFLVALLATFGMLFAVGCAGADGASGAAGAAGNPGNPGDPGAAGAPGEPGAPGSPGAPGDPGEPGAPGNPGSNGSNGAAGATGPIGLTGEAWSPLATIGAESCVVCHDGAGDDHQAVYDDYADASTFTLTIDDVVAVANAAPATDFATTVTFSIAHEVVGLGTIPYVDAAGLPSLEQKRFYAVDYDSANSTFGQSASFSASSVTPVAGTPGQYTVTDADTPYDMTAAGFNGEFYGYIADGSLDSGPLGGHVHLYDDVASAAVAYGDVATYESAANVSGCENCHGAPYMKHGYRDPVVAGLSDFASCKTCHYDSRNGGHEDWQILVEDPIRFVEVHDGADLTAAEETKYAYKASVMNDTHMSHAMEFPYPQSMATCTTCHDGKLDRILNDASFTWETCQSCHPVNGPEEGTDSHRAPAMVTVWTDAGVEGFHDTSMDCTSCHSAAGSATVFSGLHTGYDSTIYADASGTRYSDIFTASIDAVSMSDNMVTIEFSATKNLDVTSLTAADMTPTVFIGMIGYDTHQYLVNPHGRAFDDDGDGEIGRSDNRNSEAVAGEDHPRFTTVSAANGSWKMIGDLSAWAHLIADGDVTRLEIGMRPTLANAAGTTVAIDAVTRTYDLSTSSFDDSYFKGDNAIVAVEKCNTCHDALATTFHSADRGGSIEMCKMCHAATNDGSHMELQSRSIDSYVHAIHSFQAFDIGDVDFTDPVEAVKYELHTSHVLPTFSAKSCEACHNEGTYNVPSQTTSLSSLHSGTDEVADRNIGTIEAFVTGPASRACGGCHRAMLLNADDAAGLAAFQQHTQMGGYVIDDPDKIDGGTGEAIWDKVVDTIASLFK